MFLIFPQTGLPMGFYLTKKRDWTRALGWVGCGVGFLFMVYSVRVFFMSS